MSEEIARAADGIEDSQKGSFVYVLGHLVLPRFKIGKANNIIARARAFGFKEIDFPHSVGLRLKSAREALDLEDWLHRALYRWRLLPEAVRESGGRRDGQTEWFHIDCRGTLDRLLVVVSELFAVERVSSEELVNAVQQLQKEHERQWWERMERVEERRYDKDTRRLKRFERRFKRLVSEMHQGLGEQLRRESVAIALIQSGELSTLEERYLADLVGGAFGEGLRNHCGRF